MAAPNAFALLESEESQDVARFIAAEKAAAKEAADTLARKKRQDELARKERQAAAPNKQQQIDRATNSRMMRAKRVIIPNHVGRSDIVIRKDKKEEGEKHSNNGSGEEKIDGYVQDKVEQNGCGKANTDNKRDAVVSQGGHSNGGVAANNKYHGRYSQGNYRNYRDGNGYWPNRGGQNNGSRSGSESQIADDNLQVEKQKQDGDNAEEQEGWEHVGRPRSRSSSRSGDMRRNANGWSNNGLGRHQHQHQHRYYNVNDYNRTSDRRDEETINGDNKSNEAEEKPVTEDNNKTEAAQGAACEEQKGDVRGQKDSKSKQAEDAFEAKLKKLEEEREYQATLMTLDQYEKVLSMKKKTLDGLRQAKQQRMITLDKEFESMQLVEKKNEAGHKSEQDKMNKKKKDGVDKDERANSSSLVTNFRFPERANDANYRQPYYGRARNGEKPFSGRGQQDERLNPDSMTRPRNTSGNFPRLQGRKPVVNTGSKKDDDVVLINTESKKDFPAFPGTARP